MDENLYDLGVLVLVIPELLLTVEVPKNRELCWRILARRELRWQNRWPAVMDENLYDLGVLVLVIPELLLTVEVPKNRELCWRNLARMEVRWGRIT
jgi:hypothetical protein